MQEVSSRLFS